MNHLLSGVSKAQGRREMAHTAQGVKARRRPTSGVGAVRELFSAIATGHGAWEAGLDALALRAYQALQRTHLAGDAATVEDLVSTFLESLLRRAEFERLAALDDARLEGALRNRFRQLAAEAGPNWALVKALREAINRALPTLPDAPAARPSSIDSKGRLSSRSIALATAWYLAQPNPPERSAAAIARQLLTDYYPERASADSLDAAPAIQLPCAGEGPEALVVRRRDGRTQARQLSNELGPTLASVLTRRYAGQTLQQIADEDGCGVATAHSRMKAAERIVRDWVGSQSMGYSSLGAIFDQMAARSSTSERRGPATMGRSLRGGAIFSVRQSPRSTASSRLVGGAP